MKYISEIINRIKTYPGLIIFGARVVAREVAGVIMSEPYGFEIESFMVSDISNNPSKVLGISVIDVKDAPDKFKDYLVIVASMEKNLCEITEALYRRGFFNILPLTFESDIWSEVRANSYSLFFQQRFDKPYIDIDDVPGEKESPLDIHVYRAISHMDKVLYENSQDYSWEIPIQVGKKLTDKHLYELNDAIGEDNISEKNRRYCELTALYWIWKNDHSKYKGLCHYRRHFNLDERQRAILSGSDIDVVLTVPIYNEPDVYTVFSEDHIEDDWKVMMEELERLHPDYLETAKMMQASNWYYAYNMFIAKSEIFDDCCAFLFPILFECEKRIGIREDAYQGRYAGFLGERLISIYFMKHTEYKIAHCRKHFIGF